MKERTVVSSYQFFFFLKKRGGSCLVVMMIRSIHPGHTRLVWTFFFPVGSGNIVGGRVVPIPSAPRRKSF